MPNIKKVIDKIRWHSLMKKNLGAFMRYRNELEKLLKDEKNIVNRMYLNEIAIQLKKLEAVIAKPIDEDGYFDTLATMLNNFTKQFENPKYQYNKTTKNGFNPDSQIMSSIYLDDLIDVFMNDQPILKSKGMKWDNQPFSMNLNFNPHNLEDSKQDLTFDSKLSPTLLQLTQKIDLQFRVVGKRVFQRAEVILPIIIFQTCKNFTEEDFLRINYYSGQAKKSLKKSRTIIVCETIDKEVTSEIKGSYIDSLFVLRKQVSNRSLKEISSSILKDLYSRVNDYLYEDDCEVEKIIEKGYIIS